MLVLAFLARQSRQLLASFAEELVAVAPKRTLRKAALTYLRLSGVAYRFLNEACVHALAKPFRMSATMLAAWINDIGALRKLAAERKLEANVHVAWKKGAKLTPICVTTDDHCLNLLIAHKADLTQITNSKGNPKPLLHLLAEQCEPTALLFVLANGARREVNELYRGRTPCNTRCELAQWLAVICKPALRERCCVVLLQSAGTNRCLYCCKLVLILRLRPCV